MYPLDDMQFSIAFVIAQVGVWVRRWEIESEARCCDSANAANSFEGLSVMIVCWTHNRVFFFDFFAQGHLFVVVGYEELPITDYQLTLNPYPYFWLSYSISIIRRGSWRSYFTKLTTFTSRSIAMDLLITVSWRSPSFGKKSLIVYSALCTLNKSCLSWSRWMNFTSKQDTIQTVDTLPHTLPAVLSTH